MTNIVVFANKERDVFLLTENPDIEFRTELENEGTALLEVHRDADAVRIVLRVSRDQDLFGSAGVRELALHVLEGIPESVLVSVDEKSRHADSVSAVVL